LRQDWFGSPSDKGQNEEGGPHQSLHRVLHEKIRASSRAAQTARFDCTRYARLTLPVADETSARLSDVVVVFMRCVPLPIMIRNVALAMVTEVFMPVEGERRTETRGRLGSIELARLEASAAGHRAHSERERGAHRPAHAKWARHGCPCAGPCSRA
jgi:hypothetical protein